MIPFTKYTASQVLKNWVFELPASRAGILEKKKSRTERKDV